MVGKVMFVKLKTYPRPHTFQNSYGHGLETGVANQTTIYPIIMHDEGLGAPSAYEANPENANFLEAGEPNCFPESVIKTILVQMEVSMTKAALETDKLHAIKFAFMPIFTNFEDQAAIDELSTLDIGEILELQQESTDNQAFPLYNNVNMPFAGAAANSLLAANIPGLTTTQDIEGVTFQHDKYYDALQYFTNGAKLKSVQGGLKWITLTRNRPFARFNFRIRPKVKFMNKNTFFGILTHCPSSDKNNQIPLIGDTTNVTHVKVMFRARYNEWNQQFNHQKV